MKIIKELVGMLDVNCYLVKSDKTKRLYIIDPGAEPEKVIAAARKFDYESVWILLTHGHVDHISGVPGVKEALNVDVVYIHPDDQKLYFSPDNHLMPYVPVAQNLPEPQNEAVSEDFKIIHTPGHTRGGVCFYFKDGNEAALVSGDTLFAGSIGRTDFPGGDAQALLDSINNKLLTLPRDLQIFPGHGDPTTVGKEKDSNPFL